VKAADKEKSRLHRTELPFRSCARTTQAFFDDAPRYVLIKGLVFCSQGPRGFDLDGDASGRIDRDPQIGGAFAPILFYMERNGIASIL
jgi:hypothetical protein